MREHTKLKLSTHMARTPQRLKWPSKVLLSFLPTLPLTRIEQKFTERQISILTFNLRVIEAKIMKGIKMAMAFLLSSSGLIEHCAGHSSVWYPTLASLLQSNWLRGDGLLQTLIHNTQFYGVKLCRAIGIGGHVTL